jgi:hypothetical protein
VGLRRALEQIGLPAWFIAIDLLWIAKPVVLGVDARHYQRAATAWLQGGDPWAVTEYGVHYASGPHTLLFYAPTSVLPVPASTALWMLLGLASSIWLVRRLGVPIWWLAFPPLAHGIWNGNPQTIMVAALVGGTTIGAIAGVGLKLYAALVLLWRPRQCIVVGIVLAIILLVTPWQLYIERSAGVSIHLGTAWNGSAWRFPILLPPTLIALWVLRRKGAEWFVVPAAFPATQFYYGSTVLPVVAGRPLLAAVLALPVPLMTPAIVIFLALRELNARSRPRVGPLLDSASAS